MRTFFRELWCRIWHGHLMVQYAKGKGYLPDSKEQQPIAYYMCARCLKTEAVHDIQ